MIWFISRLFIADSTAQGKITKQHKRILTGTVNYLQYTEIRFKMQTLRTSRK